MPERAKDTRVFHDAWTRSATFALRAARGRSYLRAIEPPLEKNCSPDQGREAQSTIIFAPLRVTYSLQQIPAVTMPALDPDTA